MASAAADFQRFDLMAAVRLAAASGQDGGSSRRQQFRFDIAAAVFESFDQVQYRRRRHRQQSMTGLDVAAAGDQGGEKQRATIQFFPKPTEAENIDQ